MCISRIQLLVAQNSTGVQSKVTDDVTYMYIEVSQQNTFQYIHLKKASIGQKLRKSYQYPDSARAKCYLDKMIFRSFIAADHTISVSDNVTPV